MLSPDLAPLVTVIVVVVFANAINLIDGLDGLAAGIVIIAGTALFLYSDRLFKGGFLEGGNIAPLVAVIAVGICVGFLPYNFNPARIFMGDAGALFLGLLLATTTITIGGRADYQYPGTTYFFYAPLFIPIVILGVPILDTAFSLVRRVVSGTVVRGRGQGPPPPPADAPRPRPPPHRRDPVALDRAALGPRPAPDLHELGQPQRAGADRRPGPRADPLRAVRAGAAHGRIDADLADGLDDSDDDTGSRARRDRRSRSRRRGIGGPSRAAVGRWGTGRSAMGIVDDAKSSQEIPVRFDRAGGPG